MKTEVIVTRELFGVDVKQRHKSGFISANDIQIVGNKQRAALGLAARRISDYFNSKESSEFFEALKATEGVDRVRIASRGRNAVTWVHPMVAVDMALWFSPKLKVHVYSWLFDNFLAIRDMSGDSFKAMTQAIDERFNVGAKRWVYANTASAIKHACGVDDWETATQKQITARDKMHEMIIILCETNASAPLDLIVSKAVDRYRITTPKI